MYIYRYIRGVSLQMMMKTMNRIQKILLRAVYVMKLPLFTKERPKKKKKKRQQLDSIFLRIKINET